MALLLAFDFCLRQPIFLEACIFRCWILINSGTVAVTKKVTNRPKVMDDSQSKVVSKLLKVRIHVECFNYLEVVFVMM